MNGKKTWPAILEEFGIGLSRLIYYTYGGALFIAMAIIVNPTGTKYVLAGVSWQLATLTLLILGVGIYAAHRNAVIPIHHAGGCLILYVYETLRRVRVPACKSSSPTRWLGSKSVGVPWGRRISAYTTLRHSNFFSKQEEERLNILHAEAGLVVMTSEAFLLASWFAWKYPSAVASCALFWIGIVFFLASYVGPIGQHRAECWRMQARRVEVILLLKRFGIL